MTMGAWERCQAEDQYEDLVALALVRRHPQAVWLAEHRGRDMSDATLLEAVRRLQAWAASEEPQR